MHVLGQQRDSLAVHRAEIGILEESDHVILCAGLKRLEREAGPPESFLKLFLADLVDQSVEGREWDDTVRAVLQTLDLHENIGARRSLSILEVLTQEEGIHTLILVLVAGVASPSLEGVVGALLARFFEGRAFLHC